MSGSRTGHLRLRSSDATCPPETLQGLRASIQKLQHQVSSLQGKKKYLKTSQQRKGVDGKNGQDGEKGRDGIDGKDGAPGKDGKDGIAGQNGQDGKKGKDGIDGKDGAPGKDGKDGIYGQNGQDQIHAHEVVREHSPPIRSLLDRSNCDNDGQQMSGQNVTGMSEPIERLEVEQVLQLRPPINLPERIMSIFPIAPHLSHRIQVIVKGEDARLPLSFFMNRSRTLGLCMHWVRSQLMIESGSDISPVYCSLFHQGVEVKTSDSPISLGYGDIGPSPPLIVTFQITHGVTE
jgi:Collagen triple helix repeat (20 copies)